jgi:hypothetical protein
VVVSVLLGEGGDEDGSVPVMFAVLMLLFREDRRRKNQL